ncbi:HAD family hydrolase [Demequina sp. NBRC 110057]|uniref:HAD family hydrolase n=1 Tax=Demequina sp. NBRC 110057 TaxID=1570346 RepID=UPI0009FF032F|nr:HAD-IIB family hydrolase [Demequina sp. NBRC 110057]
MTAGGLRFDLDPGAPVMVALDIDDTCAFQESIDGTRTLGVVSAPVQEAIERVRAAGVHLVFATGRQTFSAVSMARQQGWGDLDLLASQGAVTVRMGADARAHEVTSRRTFDARPAIAALRARYVDLAYSVEGADGGHVVGVAHPPGTVFAPAASTMTEADAEATTALMLSSVSAHGHEMHAVIEHLDLSCHHFTELGAGWVDVSPPGVTKASGLEELRLRYGVPRGNTVAVGDGANDLPMFAWAAHSVAMGQASAEVRAAADHVTGTLADDGVVEVLDAVTRAVAAVA